MRNIIFAIALLFSTTMSVRAQDKNDAEYRNADASWDRAGKIESRQRITVYLADGKKLKGAFMGKDKSGILLRIKADKSVQISRQDILRITTRSWKRGALWGLGIGAGTGALIGVATPAKARGDFSKSTMAAVWAVPGSLVGLLVGGGIGTQQTIFNRETEHTAPNENKSQPTAH